MTDKKVALITGASSGFGYGTAEKLLATGEWVVYATARRLEKMKGLEEKGAHLIKMDVTKDSDVETGVARILTEQGRLDALLGNAGYGTYGTIENVSLDEIKYQYEVNIFGLARVIKAVLPQMRMQKSGRIVLTGSVVCNISTLGLGWYASTKHALKGMATALRQEVKHLGIQVVRIEPGAVKTEFEGVALASLRKVDHPEDYKKMVSSFDQFVVNTYKGCPGPESTIRDMFKAMTKKRPKTVYKTTLDSKINSFLQSILSDRLFDRIILSMIKT